mgnify:CR=1 FL=1|jgi:micrococcal nuclease
MSMGPSYQFPVVITRIVDGDTVDARIDMGFKIVYEERIRLLGLDTPESFTSNKKEKALGLAAKYRIKELIAEANLLPKKRGKKDIVLKTSKHGKGKFGRILGEIWINANTGEGINVNQALIDEGHARWYMGGSKGEMGEWAVEEGCSYSCGGKKIKSVRNPEGGWTKRYCDGTWTKWTPDGYVSHDVDVGI